MKFFDAYFREIDRLLAHFAGLEKPKGEPWTDAGQYQMILRRDTAFELEGVGFNLVTSMEVPDRIVLVGDDLDQIRENRPFARITLLQIEDGGDPQAAYDLIKKTDYVKYHIFPEGYMMRSTSRTYQEAVRVSKNAVKNGMTFSGVGSLMIERYHRIPGVQGVTVIFVTAEDADYSEIGKIAGKSHAVTETLNQAMNQVSFDCDTCRLKPVCDEIDGMKALHFSNRNR